MENSIDKTRELLGMINNISKRFQLNLDYTKLLEEKIDSLRDFNLRLQKDLEDFRASNKELKKELEYKEQILKILRNN